MVPYLEASQTPRVQLELVVRVKIHFTVLTQLQTTKLLTKVVGLTKL